MNHLRENTVLSVLGLVLLVWLIYLAVEIARHVGAWPFG